MKPIRLALSGSGTRFYAHMGAVARLMDQGYAIAEVIGTSGGALVGAAAGAGFGPKDLRDLALKYPPQTVLSARWWPFEPKYGSRGLIETKRALRAFRTVLPETFAELQVPCHIATTNWTRRGKPVIWQSGDLPLTVLASMSLPVFDMVEIQGILVENKAGICYGFNAREPQKSIASPPLGVKGVISTKPELYEDGGVSGNFWVDFDGWRTKTDTPLIGLKASGKGQVATRTPPKTKIERVVATLSDLVESGDREKIEDAPGAKVCYVRSQYSGFEFSYSKDDISRLLQEGADSVDEFLEKNPI